MESPELERFSADPTGHGTGKRGPNPNRDYKRHFQRQKERYTAVTADQNSRKKELSRAGLKQIKLQEEIEFLVDAIAGERHRRQQIQADDEGTAQHHEQQQRQRSRQQRYEVEEDEDVLPSTTEPHAPAVPDLGEPEEDVKPVIVTKPRKDAVDEELEDLMDDDASPSSYGRRPQSAPKRQRPPSNDTDDELLESAGISASKRARNG